MKRISMLALWLVACDDGDGGGGSQDTAVVVDGGSVDGAPADARVDAVSADATSADATVRDAAVRDALPADAMVPRDAAADVSPPDAAPMCVAEGGAVPVVPDAPACCEGLAPIGCDQPDGRGQCPGGCEGASVCARCGNGACGPGENVCNCPADCAEVDCVGEGDSVPVIPNAPGCCGGLAPIGCDQPDAQGMCLEGCVGASICAQCGDGACGPGENLCNCPADCENPGQCTPEGQAVPVVPNAPPCCAGTQPIACDRPDPEGECSSSCVGASICARCGDGACGPGENVCNCPADCAEVDCVGEGDLVPVIPNAPGCCRGLAPIGCDQPDDQGMCSEPCVGASICARCGDGVCGAGENPCNCPQDCPLDGLCRSTLDCLDHNAPIRCLGAWRCDPRDVVASDHQGVDGCNYTCLGNLPVCNDRQPCPEGSRCAPCPVPDGGCDGAMVCRAGDDTSCQAPADCDGLPHIACVGAWSCEANRCAWRCGG